MDDTIVYPKEAIIKTNKYSFHLHLTPYKNRNTCIVEKYNITLGCPDTKCITLSVPARHMHDKSGKIASIERKTDCSFETSDKPGFSQHLLLLGLTIARDINPSVTKFYFDDCSHIDCTMPDGSTIPISLRNTNITFHGASWYEQHFGAKLVTGHSEYRRRVENLYNPDKKPPTFDFNNTDLNELLTPLYMSSETWADFFKAIRDNYDKRKCAIIYPWFMNALYIIFDGNMFDNMKWYIDVEDNGLTPLVPFTTYTVRRQQRGAGHTRRVRRYRYPAYMSFTMNPNRVRKYNYKRFLQKR